MRQRGMSQAYVARWLGRPAKTISELCTGKAAITPETALQLEALFTDIPAITWLYREAEFRLSEAREVAR